MSYLDLKEKSRYLKTLKLEGKDRDLRSDEITSCEEYATAIIEGKLGKSWETGDSGDVPTLIEHVADLLGSAKAYNFLLTGQAPNEGDYPKRLREEAFDLLDKIISGEIGLKLPSGAWDPDYPGNSNVEEEEPTGGIDIIYVG